jgi:hypothetical protein
MHREVLEQKRIAVEDPDNGDNDDDGCLENPREQLEKEMEDEEGEQR